MVDVIKFCPGARYSESKGGWFPVVRIFKNNKPAGSKTGCRASASPSIAEAHAINAANTVARDMAEPYADSAEIVVALPKHRETLMMPRPRPIGVSPFLSAPYGGAPLNEQNGDIYGAVAGTRVLQVQV